ncbi:acyl carrier protein [Sciscionella marina]|uniref:acyl carrier protein n=1 Tax=Sciscionella marina TaxID=508770 RepID=UPI00035F5B21|nr:acyl carrier protein [Sciscionella marina]
MRELTLEELVVIMRENMGDEYTAPHGTELLDMEFTALGYDSLALLEMLAHVKRKYGIAVSDDEVEGIQTPRVFLEKINAAAGN